MVDWKRPDGKTVALALVAFVLIVSFTPCQSVSGWKGPETRTWGFCPDAVWIYATGGMITDVGFDVLGFIDVIQYSRFILLGQLLFAYALAVFARSLFEKR